MKKKGGTVFAAYSTQHVDTVDATFVTLSSEFWRIRNRIGFARHRRFLPQIRLHHSVIEILVTYLPCASIRDPRGFIPGRIIRLDEREQERATIEKSMKRGRGGGGPDRSRNSRNFKTDRLLLVAD